MHRFYLERPDICRGTVTITDPRIVHQAGKVLRMRPGDSLSVFDQKGQEQSLCVLEIDKRKLLCQIIEPIFRDTEPSIAISLYQAIPKKVALFEFVVQKATELGVSHIYPLITERTEKRRLGKFERLSAIVMEAAEQCNRTRVPVIHHPVSFETALAQVTHGYMAYEFDKSKSLLNYGSALKEGRAIQLFIGPEGGWTQKEVDLAERAGVHRFHLGPRTLRMETAAIASLALLLP
ncbi:MAG: RsmE family RNA methyltransferase [Candidatus Peregrinibacteria bacterium]